MGQGSLTKDRRIEIHEWLSGNLFFHAILFETMKAVAAKSNVISSVSFQLTNLI